MSESTQTPEPSFGSWIKQQRLERKVSLEEIAAVTKVHIAQLRMIEEDQWKDLPASAFVRGFLVCYARHLALDEEEVLRRYKIAMGSRLKTIEAALPEGHRSVQSATRPKVRVATTPNFQKSPGARDIQVKSSPTLTPKVIGIAVASLLAVVCLILLISLGRKSEPKVEVKETPAAETTEVAPTPVAPPLASATPVPAPQFILELVGVEESWVNVKNGDQNAQGFSLRANERKSFTVSPSVQLVLSNAGAVEVHWEGKSYAAPGFRGDVKTLQLPSGLASLTEKKFVAKKVIAPRSAPPATATPAPATPAATDAPATPGTPAD
ncbi:MAG: RodZ domain-containing protein [Bdellovibrionota bacterium]